MFDMKQWLTVTFPKLLEKKLIPTRKQRLHDAAIASKWGSKRGEPRDEPPKKAIMNQLTDQQGS